MKFLSTVLSAFFLSMMHTTTNAEGNPTGCIDAATFDPQADYFPDKVVVEDSEMWSIEYGNNYKIINNKAAKETYLLYQCGTEPPAAELSAGHAAVVSVPVQNGVAFTGTGQLIHLELLGLRDQVTGYLGNTDYLSSDCLLDLIEQGEVLAIQNTSDIEALSQIVTEDGDEPLVFKGSWDSVTLFENQIIITESSESTNKGTFEWHKFYAAFFNLEAKATEQVAEIADRYNCVAENAAFVTSDGAKKVVLWAYYSAYSGGWSVAKCDNYYCEYAEACSASILSDEQGSIPVPFYDGNFDKNLAEFVEFGKDADVWIFPSSGWNNLYSENGEALDQFKSVQNKKVYDYMGVGEDAWFGERRAEYDVVLQDFCDVVGNVSPIGLIHQRRWLRNVFTEAEGTIEQCADLSAPFETKATECTRLTSASTDSPTSAPTDATSSANVAALFNKFVTAAAFALAARVL